MAVLLLVMGGNEFFSYAQMSQRLNQSIQTREKQMAQRLPASLALPLWNMDTATADTLVSLEMLDTDVRAIVVTTDSGVRGKVKDQSAKTVDYSEANAKDLAASKLLKLQANITFQDKTIGSVDVYFSNASAEAQLAAELVRTSVMTLAVILVLALSTFLVTRFLVGLSRSWTRRWRVLPGEISATPCRSPPVMSSGAWHQGSTK